MFSVHLQDQDLGFWFILTVTLAGCFSAGNIKSLFGTIMTTCFMIFIVATARGDTVTALFQVKQEKIHCSET